MYTCIKLLINPAMKLKSFIVPIMELLDFCNVTIHIQLRAMLYILYTEGILVYKKYNAYNAFIN